LVALFNLVFIASFHINGSIPRNWAPPYRAMPGIGGYLLFFPFILLTAVEIVVRKKGWISKHNQKT